jgi:peptidoglycan endopeptidase LytE
MPNQVSAVTLMLFQKDYFVRQKRVFNKVKWLTSGKLNYLPLSMVLEILEYDIYRRNTNFFTVTDGSEIVAIPRTGSTARREGVSFQIDPLIILNREQFISFRSINRLFNVDLLLYKKVRRVSINQPGRSIITVKGDTLRSLSKLLNTTVKRLLSLNKTLKEPIAPDTKVRIPTIDFAPVTTSSKKPSLKQVEIKQTADIAPAIIALGRSLKGTLYQFGAKPYPWSKKFDCSSYTQYIFGRNKVVLPRTSRAQARVGKRILQKDIEPGDLIFFRRDRYSDNRIGHVGLDIGNGYMLNTYDFPPGVTVTKWRSPFWLHRYINAREIL